MTLQIIALATLGCAAIPALLFLINLGLYRRLPRAPAAAEMASNTAGRPLISVLIPARNEEANIASTLEAVLANTGPSFEVVVLDDHSTDRTAAIVAEYAARDTRLRLDRAPALPGGWCGKQHACHVLAGKARAPWRVFVDADVRLEPDALARIYRFMQRSGADLASGVPRQEMVTFFERLLIPLIHFMLLGFLPIFLMRRLRWTAFGAGCGQLMIVRAEAYERAGGHGAIRASLHDGIKLPRAFRQAGLKTDLFDATTAAACRMYRTNTEVWRGLEKNATEGLAAPGAILPMTFLLFAGQVLPLALALTSFGRDQTAFALSLAALALAGIPRALATWRFRQPILSTMLHPAGVTALLIIQWGALAKSLYGRPSEWKGRAYPASGKSVGQTGTRPEPRTSTA